MPPSKHICLLTDDGSPLTPKLARTLAEYGWKVLILAFPESVVSRQLPLPKSLDNIMLESLDEQYLGQQLVVIAANYGPPAAFIHLNPLSCHEDSQGYYFHESEAAIVKGIFFITKHLKKSLNKAASLTRGCFITVVRLDGELGLGGATNFGVIGTGLFGLTKTLNLECKSLFCRAIDLDPAMSNERAAQAIIDELYDPNIRLTEVGYGVQGRATLIAEPPV